jgi:hypothetical protein
LTLGEILNESRADLAPIPFEMIDSDDFKEYHKKWAEVWMQIKEKQEKDNKSEP